MSLDSESNTSSASIGNVCVACHFPTPIAITIDEVKRDKIEQYDVLRDLLALQTGIMTLHGSSPNSAFSASVLLV